MQTQGYIESITLQKAIIFIDGNPIMVGGLFKQVFEISMKYLESLSYG